MPAPPRIPDRAVHPEQWLAVWAASVQYAIGAQGVGLLWPSPSMLRKRLHVPEIDALRLRALLVEDGNLSLWRNKETVTSPFGRLDPDCGELELTGELHPCLPVEFRADAVALLLADAVKVQGGGLVVPGIAVVASHYGTGERAARRALVTARARGCLTKVGLSYVSAPGWGVPSV